MFIVQIALFVLTIVSMWRVFTKAGQPGWAAIVPIYNMYVFLLVIRKPWWWLLLLFVPLVNIVFIIMMLNELSKVFGQGVGFTLGLLFLSPIFLPILAFGNYPYKSLSVPVAADPNQGFVPLGSSSASYVNQQDTQNNYMNQGNPPAGTTPTRQ